MRDIVLQAQPTSLAGSRLCLFVLFGEHLERLNLAVVVEGENVHAAVEVGRQLDCAVVGYALLVDDDACKADKVGIDFAGWYAAEVELNLLAALQDAAEDAELSAVLLIADCHDFFHAGSDALVVGRVDDFVLVEVPLLVDVGYGIGSATQFDRPDG